jgi:hypothetical protein
MLKFQKTFTSTVATSGKVYCQADNMGRVYLNNEFVGESSRWESTDVYDINILQGENVFPAVQSHLAKRASVS